MHLWHHGVGQYVWQKCLLHHELIYCCCSLVKSTPTWLCHEELKLSASVAKMSTLQSNHTKPSNRNIGTFSVFSGQLVSQHGVPFKNILKSGWNITSYLLYIPDHTRISISRCQLGCRLELRRLVTVQEKDVWGQKFFCLCFLLLRLL